MCLEESYGSFMLGPQSCCCPQLTVFKDRKTNERLGIHCLQQIVEAVKEDAAVTGTFSLGLSCSTSYSYLNFPSFP